MRLWAEVFTPTNTALGIVNLAALSFTAKLDGAGDFNFEIAPTDRAAFDILAVRRRVRLYTEIEGQRHFIGEGILLNQTVAARASGPAAQWKGADLLDELRRVNTLRGRVYVNQAVSDIIADLIGEAADWLAYFTTDAGPDTCRFDGQSILAAILSIVKRKGVHIRLGPAGATRRIQVGAFGAASGVKAVQAAAWSPDLTAAGQLALIETLQVVTDGSDIVNWLEPVIGSGDAVYTLRRSTRTGPYPIQTTTGPDGRTVYYLSDEASITAYGVSQTVKDMRDPVPLEAVSTTLVNVANALYDWAANWLARNAQPHPVYRVSLKNAPPILVGNTARLIYRGYAPTASGEMYYLDVNAEVYVLRVTQKWGKDGQSTDWEVSTSDVLPETPAEAVARLMRESHTQALAVRFAANGAQYSASGTVDPSTPLTFTFEIPLNVIDVGRCVLTVERTDKTPSGPGAIAFTYDGVVIPGGPVFWGNTDLTASLDFESLVPLTDVTGSHTIVAYCGLGAGAISLKAAITQIVISAN